MREWQRQLYEAGYVGRAWPAEFGGGGRPTAEQIVVDHELAAAGAPELVAVVGLDVLGPALLEFGTDEQKRRHVAPILSADEIWSQGFSEPEAGSDLASLLTSAVETDAGWVLNGQKTWISWGQFSRWCGVLARTDPDVPRHKGISLFILDMETPGIDLRPMVQITGHAEFCEIFLDDVVVPRENMLGERGQGWKIAMHVVAHERGTARRPAPGDAADLVRPAGRRRQVDDRRRRAPARRRAERRRRWRRRSSRSRRSRHHASRTMSPFLNGDPVGPESSTVKLLLAQGRAEARRRPPSRCWETPAARGFWHERYLYSRAASRVWRYRPDPARRSSPTGSSPSPRTDVELQLTAEQGCSPRAFASWSDEVRRGRVVTRRQAKRSGRTWSTSACSRSAVEAELGTVELALIARGARRASRRRPARRYGRAAPRCRHRSSTVPALSSAALGLGEPERSFAPSAPRRHSRATAYRGPRHPSCSPTRPPSSRVPADSTDGAVLALVRPDAPGVDLEPEPTLDPSLRPATVRLDEVAPERVLGSPSTVDRVAATAAVLGAAEAVGAAATVLALARDYAAERRQFGHPIGSFQAVRHLLADMVVLTESSWSSVLYAAASLDEREPDSLRTAAVAKAWASRATLDVAHGALQVFGGVGFTAEHHAHLYLRRIASLGSRYGSAADHERELGRSLAHQLEVIQMSNATFLPTYLETLDTTPLDVVPMLAPNFAFTVLWNDDEGAKEFSGRPARSSTATSPSEIGRPPPPRRRFDARRLARGRPRAHDAPRRAARDVHHGRPGRRRGPRRAPVRCPHDLTPPVWPA